MFARVDGEPASLRVKGICLPALRGSVDLNITDDSVARLAPANAAIVGVTEITIQNALNTWLHVGEVEAFNQTSQNVIQLGATASANPSGTWDANSTPDRAIDGNVNTNFYAAPYIYHPNVEQNVTLTINLNSPADLTSLTIFGRTDCCTYRDLYNVSLFNSAGQLLSSFELDATNSASATETFASAVPEPSTWAMLILGFAGLGFVGYRRNGKAALC